MLVLVCSSCANWKQSIDEGNFSFTAESSGTTAGREGFDLFLTPYDNNLHFYGNIITPTRCSNIIGIGTISNRTILVELEIIQQLCTEEPDLTNKPSLTWYSGDFRNLDADFYNFTVFVDGDSKISKTVRVPGINPAVECIQDSECVPEPGCFPQECVNTTYAFRNSYNGACVAAVLPIPICKCVQNKCAVDGFR